MFGIGLPELMVILVVALVVLGPKRLPDVARMLGRGLAEFRRATSEFKGNLEREVDLSEIESAGREISETVSEAKDLGVARGSILSPDEPPSSPPTDATDDQLCSSRISEKASESR